MLLALAIGLIANPYSDNVVQARVKHAGPPVPASIVIRSKPTRDASWEYVAKPSYTPRRLRTSPLGKQVTVRIPDGLHRFVQVCAVIDPPEPQPYVASFGLQSCANLPTRNR
jgi:hypothetical protein